MKQFDVMANVPQRVWAIDESLLKETGVRYMTKYVDVDVNNFNPEFVQDVLPGYTELVKVMAKDSEEALELAAMVFEKKHSSSDVVFQIVNIHEEIQQNTVYMLYRCDQWLSKGSKELVYVATNLEDGIAQIKAYRGCTDKQAEQIRKMMQSQCNNTDSEWLVEEIKTNTFVD